MPDDSRVGVDSLPVWLEAGRRPLDWNGPVGRSFVPFPDPALERPIIEHLQRAVRRHPDRIAIRDIDTALTYGELWDGLSGLAETLAARSEPEELIGILLPACPMFALAMFACLAAGRPFVALDTHYPPEWLDHVLKDARPGLIVTGDRGLAHIRGLAPAMRVLRVTELPETARASWRAARLRIDEPACVLYTSGSTGRPKGIVNSQRNLLQRVAQSINAAHINAEDRLLTLASPCTIVGVRDVMTALLAGASVHLLDPQSAGAREILESIRAEGITILFAFPALLRSVVAASAERATAGLRLVRIGGDVTLWRDIELLRSWLAPGTDIQLIYAATEAPMLQWFVDDACRGDSARIPIGYPLPGNRLAIVDDDGRTTPPGEAGELIVASPYVSLGRWINGGCADESVARCRTRAARLFRTGDLVRQRSDGLLELIGRKDRQVKIGGVRIDLDGVAAALRAHPSVKDVAALARTSGVEGTVSLVAYVSARDPTPAGLVEELKELMRSVPRAMRPVHFYLTDRIPRLPSSKLDVRALVALDDANVQSEAGKPVADTGLALGAGDHIAQTVARVWQNVLRAPVRGPEDDFLDAGGDSLQAITLTMEIEAALGLELSPTLIYDVPRFSQLCDVLRQLRAPHRDLLIPLKAGADTPPVYFIHGLGGNVLAILPTARRLAYQGAVIGIRARGLARGEVPHSSVEAMAADYLQEIQAHQPSGPYFLCGYSFGGLVAFEMARRLSESGERVELVGLFDTMTRSLDWPLRVWLSVIGRRTARLVRRCGIAPLRTGSAELHELEGRLRRTKLPVSMQRNDPSVPGIPPALATRVMKVAASALIASARYRAGFYRGHLTLFVPVGRARGLPPLETVWRKHAHTLAIVETAGDHSTMLSAPNADSTAASLTRCLSAPVVSRS